MLRTLGRWQETADGGRDYTNQRWSPLTQITTANVHNLQVSWIYQTGISRLGSFETSRSSSWRELRDDAVQHRDGGRCAEWERDLAL